MRLREMNPGPSCVQAQRCISGLLFFHSLIQGPLQPQAWRPHWQEEGGNVQSPTDLLEEFKASQKPLVDFCLYITGQNTNNKKEKKTEYADLPTLIMCAASERDCPVYWTSSDTPLSQAVILGKQFNTQFPI